MKVIIIDDLTNYFDYIGGLLTMALLGLPVHFVAAECTDERKKDTYGRLHSTQHPNITPFNYVGTV